MSDLIIAYPREWYAFTSVTFQLRAMSLVSPRTFMGGNNVYGPHAQMWMPKLVSAVRDIDTWPEISALFSRLGGQAGLLRMSDPSRLKCRYNRERVGTQQVFSDGTAFTDGTGFADGLMPSFGFVIEAAARGDVFVKIGGLLPGITKALAPGDLFELRPNGIADDIPSLHEVVAQGNTDASGQTGVEIRPPLRRDYAPGDQVVLDHPTSVFHLIDDTQGEMEISAPVFANFGFALIEAIERA